MLILAIGLCGIALALHVLGYCKMMKATEKIFGIGKMCRIKSLHFKIVASLNYIHPHTLTPCFEIRVTHQIVFYETCKPQINRSDGGDDFCCCRISLTWIVWALYSYEMHFTLASFVKAVPY